MPMTPAPTPMTPTPTPMMPTPTPIPILPNMSGGSVAGGGAVPVVAVAVVDGGGVDAVVGDAGVEASPELTHQYQHLFTSFHSFLKTIFYLHLHSALLIYNLPPPLKLFIPRALFIALLPFTIPLIITIAIFFSRALSLSRIPTIDVAYSEGP
ncbi:hypothetical protein BU17DRAFT_95575 [Hysterangium stoloniferum]|nr:hypothetical protein BU17DRAFT_95575 [Hysterangium stoloniferum]